jgi:hypothetical protein
MHSLYLLLKIVYVSLYINIFGPVKVMKAIAAFKQHLLVSIQFLLIALLLKVTYVLVLTKHFDAKRTAETCYVCPSYASLT